MVDGFTYAKALLDSGRKVHIVIEEAHDPVTAKQRGFLHAAVLPQISEQVVVEVGGKRERYTPDLWKQYYFKLLVKPKYKMRKLPGQKRATPYRVNDSSEKLGVGGYAKWIDGIIDHAIAEFHVDFVFDLKEREELRYRPKQS